MVARADHEQHAVAPCEPVEQAGERADGTLERTVPNPDRQVDDRDVRGYRATVALIIIEQPAHRSMHEVDDERILRHRFVAVSPVPRVRTENRAHVQGP